MVFNADKLWIAALDGAQVVAVQHGCGVGDRPVNCNLDEYLNWVCPNCGATYGAAMPLEGWKTTILSTENSHSRDK